jgi:hypothetical protein
VNWSNKAKVRTFALGNTPKKSLSLLPGANAYDVIEAVESGVITPSSNLVLSEKEKKIFFQMKTVVTQALPKHYKLPRFHFGPLHTLRLDRRLDYFWADLCGNLDLETMFWIDTHLQNWISEETDLLFTFSSAERGNTFMGALKKIVRGYNRFLSKRDTGIISHMVCLQYLFRNWDYRIVDIPYKNKLHGLPMVLYKLDCLKRRTRPEKTPFAQMFPKLLYNY